MNYTQAVQLAKAGNEQGFEYLYKNTYQSKYYLALQYMKNKEAAEDVLQEAYMRAFSKLDTLKNPEYFSTWLGQIVANTAKNALAKKNPLLFTDIIAETDNDDFIYHIEDEDVDTQPELSYTREETKKLVREMIDTLSDEQRLCILMFHIEEISIKEIAKTLNCSENTVKSRLNYGRKNLKIKAEELQKKGYKLYNIAPLPLLLLLLHNDLSEMLADGTIQTQGYIIADKLFSQFSDIRRTSSFTQTNATSSTNKTRSSRARASKTGFSKAGFLHTVAGKAAITVLGICIAGSAIYGITQIPKQNTKETTTLDRQKNTKQNTKDAQAPQASSVTDADYPNLLEGNLTKEELEFVLAYGPETLTEQGLSEQDYLLILNCLCEAAEANNAFITFRGYDNNYRHGYSIDDINRYLSSFTNYRFTEDNDSDTPYGNDVRDDTLWISQAELSFETTATIKEATYLEDTMKVHFSYEKNSYEDGITTMDKLATLKKNENGKFQIITIAEEAAADKKTDLKNSGEERNNTVTSENTDSIRSIYEKVLQSVQNQEPGYNFPNSAGSTDFYYFLWDMNKDGIQELVIGAMCVQDVFEAYNIRVFTVAKSSSGYTLKSINGDITSLGFYLPTEGKGLYSTEMSRGTGENDISRITIEEDTLTLVSSLELTYTMGDSTETQFINSNRYAEWTRISNLSELNKLK